MYLGQELKPTQTPLHSGGSAGPRGLAQQTSGDSRGLQDRSWEPRHRVWNPREKKHLWGPGAASP